MKKNKEKETQTETEKQKQEQLSQPQARLIAHNKRGESQQRAPPNHRAGLPGVKN